MGKKNKACLLYYLRMYIRIQMTISRACLAWPPSPTRPLNLIPLSLVMCVRVCVCVCVCVCVYSHPLPMTLVMCLNPKP